MFVDGYNFHLLPSNVDVYEHQIAGHGFGLKETKRKVLQGDDDTVYKPVQAFPKGQREIDFYQKVYESSCGQVVRQLRRFLPHFHGIYINPETGDKYICLEDVLCRFKRPTVADIKIGALTYTPDACPKKVLAEKAKYSYREQVGFLFTGIKVYRGTDNFDYFDKQHGNSLDCEEVYTKGILEFLGRDKVRAKQLARKFVHKLHRLKAWFEMQTALSFYSSSLLLAYEGCPSKTSRSHNNSNIKNFLNVNSTKITKETEEDSEDDMDSNSDIDDNDDVVVGWVDFTHTVPLPSDQSKHDENFLFGLNNLISYFQMTYSGATNFYPIADSNCCTPLDSPELNFSVSAQSNSNLNTDTILSCPLNAYMESLKNSSMMSSYSPADSAYSDSDSSGGSNGACEEYRSSDSSREYKSSDSNNLEVQSLSFTKLVNNEIL